MTPWATNQKPAAPAKPAERTPPRRGRRFAGARAAGRPALAIVVLTLLSSVVAPAPAAGAEDVFEVRAALDANYSRELADLAAWCETSGLLDEAEAVRRWRPAPAPGVLRLFLHEDPVMAPPTSGAADSAAPDSQRAPQQTEFHERFAKLRTEQAHARYELARQAVPQHRGSLVMELVTEAAREAPDLQPARRMLGEIAARDGGWQTVFAARQEAAGKRWSPRFGWLPQNYLAKYDQGLRFCQGQWVAPQREAELRRDIRRGWRIENEHFNVVTNVSLEAGVELSRRLERFHRIWQQLFIRYLASEAELTKWLDGRGVRPAEPKHEVVYFQSREEYVDALKRQQPLIEGTLGIYFDRDRRSYFYAGQEVGEAAVVEHEATHQLFQESRRTAKDVGRKGNFWIVEGVACYLESLEFRDGYAELGGPRAGRLPAARRNALQDGYYMPLAALVRLNVAEIQQHPDIAKLYSQATGLATFLMQGAGGKYREPLIAYLDAVYQGRADDETLARLTGAGYQQLDAEYRAFLAEGAATSTVQPTARLVDPSASPAAAAP